MRLALTWKLLWLCCKPNEVVVGTGAKFILYAFFATVINPGDEVIIPTPCWVSYVDQVKMVEGVPVTFQTTEANHFKATVEQLEAARTEKPKLSCLILHQIQQE